MPVIWIITPQDTAFVISCHAELQTVSNEPFPSRVGSTLILLTYQQLPVKLILSVDHGCTHSSFHNYLNQTQYKTEGRILSTPLFTEPLISFPVGSETLVREKTTRSYLSCLLMRRSYAFKAFLKLRSYTDVVQF